MDWRLQNPEWLWLLLLIPILAILRGRKGGQPAIRFPSLQLFGFGSRPPRSRAGRLLGLLRMLGLAALVVALARPQFGTDLAHYETSGIDIMLLVDLSGSMRAHDFEIGGEPVDRLVAVQHVIGPFIDRRPNDRIGLVAFAPEAHVISPLTNNHRWLRRALDHLHIGIINPNGTAIGVALATALARFDFESEISPVVILLTDGANNTGHISPMAAAETAAALGVRVYTIAAGRLDHAPFPRLDPDGEPLRDRRGNLIFQRVAAELDLETLEQIAELTGGRSFHADRSEDLEAIYEEIDQLERIERTLTVQVEYHDAFFWPLTLGLVFLILEQLLAQTRLRRLP